MSKSKKIMLDVRRDKTNNAIAIIDCEDCGFSFILESNNYSKAEKHIGGKRWYKCPMCEREIEQHSIVPILLHEDSLPEWVYDLEVCEEKYETKSEKQNEKI